MRGLRLFAFFALTVFTLTACSFSDSPSGGQAAAPPVPGQAASPPQTTTMDTFRALAPSTGMKFTPLFAEEAGNDDERFRRLEQAVQSMKNDFDTVMPSIVRLVAVEKDINELVGQLQTLTGGGPIESEPLGLEEKLNRIPREDNAGGTENEAVDIAAASLAPDTSRVTPEAASAGQLPPEGAASPSSTSASAPLDIKQQTQSAPPVSAPIPAAPVVLPEPPPVAKTEVAPAPVSAPAATGPVLGDVKSVRIGDHMDKTRIVLDMTAKANFGVVLQNNGKQLVIDLPQMSFSAQKNWDAMSAMLVSAYRYENGKLVLDLLYPSEIKSQMILSPNGSPLHRLVIDLFSKGVHQ